MRPSFIRCWSVLALVCSCVVSVVLPADAVFAQAGAASSVGYEEAIRHAVEEYSLGHWTEARFFFARAHELNPNARTLRGLGLTCYESRNYVEATTYFAQALASSEQPLTDKMRVDVEQLLLQAQQFVTRVKVTLQPATATLEVDHAARTLDADQSILLDPGPHELLAKAEGYASERQSIRAEGGEQHIDLRLQKLSDGAVAAAPMQDPVGTSAEPESGGSDIAPYIVIAAGGAALAVGAVLVGIASADKSAVENAEPGTTWSELEPRYNRGRTFFPVGFALMGVGLAGAAAGLTWKLWPTQERGAHATLRLSPLAATLSGRF